MDKCHNAFDESFLELEKVCSETDMGQSESKKSKKISGTETKGTSISFGFKKKKIYSTSPKKLNIANKIKNDTAATIFSNHNVDDDNGNNSEVTNDKESKEATSRSLQSSANNSNRFGFTAQRHNIIRPSKVGVTQKYNEIDNINNNKVQPNASKAVERPAMVVDNDKRRPRSATVANRFNVNIQPMRTVKEERIPNTVVNTLPPVTLSRYTLQSTSLPRPQYAIPVNVPPPSYKRSTTFTSLSASRPNQVQSKLMDTKGAKHAANLEAKKRDGLMGRRDESLDSGIASQRSDSVSDHHQLYINSMISRRPRQRSRHFEMIPTGRHKFEIRDLSEFSDSSVVVPLNLPKLRDCDEIVTGGLIRSTNSYSIDHDTDMSISCGSNTRPSSFISSTDSFEEEKVKIDNSFTEKGLQKIIKEDTQSRMSSPASSKASWFGRVNESMATENCSSISLSSSDEEREVSQKYHSKKDEDCDDEDLSTMTMTVDHSSYASSLTLRTSPNKDHKDIVNDAFIRQQPKIGSITRKEMLMEMEELKFAETVKICTENLTLLEEETSPTDSLVSSDSGEAVLKKQTVSKTIFDDIKEQDLEDTSHPELLDLVSPGTTPGTPTHASNSFSLSDGGNKDEFLIDDEICDQPALVFNKKHNGSPLHTASLNITSDTLTLKEMKTDSKESLISLNKILTLKRESPKKRTIERSGSYDTLSPCDSLASDDLMDDFEINSSIDSIMPSDDLNVNLDADFRSTACTKKESESFTKFQQTVQHRHTVSQLPARASYQPRLLSRRLQNNSNSALSQNGSDSPRSLDSMHSHHSTSLRDHLRQRQQLNLQSNLLNSSSEDLTLDKSQRNGMLQDVVSFKKQLVQLRRILQESDTLNPFNINGQIFSNLEGRYCDNQNESNSNKEKKDDENNVVLTNEQMVLLEDQRQELADLRRQVVFLQSQMDDKDRTIRIQQNKIEQYEKEKNCVSDLHATSPEETVERITCATQTERLRPVSMGQENITSSTKNKDMIGNQLLHGRQIPIKPTFNKTSIYTKLSSTNKSSSIPNFSAKPVKTTQIGNSQVPTTKTFGIVNNLSSINSPRKIPQLVKLAKGGSKISSKTLLNFIPKSNGGSNGNSASSLSSTSSSSFNLIE